MSMVLDKFRPISNLSFLSKLTGKATTLSQLLPHFKDNRNISNFQSAYRQNHYTETAHCRIYNDILLDSDKSKTSILILLDLSAAFYIIDHTLLIDDLNPLMPIITLEQFN